ncbi:hypothetical protein CAPTEDRAFT_199252 [Capitella teleta]|uniref:Uncharacterized protein n=1 Tax=Capitella teleta TaxID=283909 RepID=R7UCF7_CAPTE|nr:hypothetical protein CAPTEDRAFT_199252 [Capitella teleta]|eukprot:ELU03806.1 hypothetical protein CAPTEDRAFT_199252 [Capitella teleta]
MPAALHLACNYIPGSLVRRPQPTTHQAALYVALGYIPGGLSKSKASMSMLAYLHPFLLDCSTFNFVYCAPRTEQIGLLVVHREMSFAIGVNLTQQRIPPPSVATVQRRECCDLPAGKQEFSALPKDTSFDSLALTLWASSFTAINISAAQC